jgi:hypothetical protein
MQPAANGQLTPQTQAPTRHSTLNMRVVQQHLQRSAASKQPTGASSPSPLGPCTTYVKTSTHAVWLGACWRTAGASGCMSREPLLPERALLASGGRCVLQAPAVAPLRLGATALQAHHGSSVQPAIHATHTGVSTGRCCAAAPATHAGPRTAQARIRPTHVTTHCISLCSPPNKLRTTPAGVVHPSTHGGENRTGNLPLAHLKKHCVSHSASMQLHPQCVHTKVTTPHGQPGTAVKGSALTFG